MDHKRNFKKDSTDQNTVRVVPQVYRTTVTKSSTLESNAEGEKEQTASIGPARSNDPSRSLPVTRRVIHRALVPLSSQISNSKETNAVPNARGEEACSGTQESVQHSQQHEKSMENSKESLIDPTSATSPILPQSTSGGRMIESSANPSSQKIKRPQTPVKRLVFAPSSSSQVRKSKTLSPPRTIRTQQTFLTEYPEDCFLVESAQQKDHYWCVTNSVFHHNHVVLRQSPLEKARHDARFLWFRVEGEPFIYSMLKKNGEHLVLDYHESTYSLGLSKSMVVKRRKTHKALQHYDIVPDGGIECLLVRMRNFKVGNDKMMRLKKGGRRETDPGEWRTIPAAHLDYDVAPFARSSITESEVKKISERDGIVNLPIDPMISQWFMDINMCKSQQQLDQAWDVAHLLGAKDEFGYNALMRCILRDNWRLANHFLNDYGPSNATMQVQSRNDYKQTALHLAAYRGHLSVVHSLIEKGADIAAQDRNGCTALFDAASRNQVVLLDYFMQKNTALVTKPNLLSQNILHFCIIDKCAGSLQHLLESGMLEKSMLSQLDQHGYSPIHYAAADGYLEGLRLLLDYGSDPNWQSDEDNETPLHLAAANSHENAIIAILSYCNKMFIEETLTDTAGLTAQQVAMRNGIGFPNVSIMQQYNPKQTSRVVKRVGRGTSSTASPQLPKPTDSKIRLNREHVLQSVPFQLIAERTEGAVEDLALCVDLETRLKTKDSHPRYPVVLMPRHTRMHEQEFAMNRYNHLLSLGTNAAITFMPDTQGRLRLVAAHPHSLKKIRRWIFKAGHLCTADGEWCVVAEKDSSMDDSSSRQRLSFTNGNKHRNSAFRGIQMRGVGLMLKRIQKLSNQERQIVVRGERSPTRFILEVAQNS
eukprot:CAMPEP_0117438458 /NCGR_PEP_ID=MMETSP0759-20121206/2063_1 /TAXON_ID=63605 /ORGANISM="Percolomonas cosmopolitus, Strain WS" /LENGTH=873 /DNA_ID=CAMNT_0005230149 /DNA_START=160 /DNA_END=2781 /DNA_ORIENTATION=+